MTSLGGSWPAVGVAMARYAKVEGSDGSGWVIGWEGGGG